MEKIDVDTVIKGKGWRQMKNMSLLDTSISSDPNLMMVKILSEIEHELDLTILAQCFRYGADPNIYVSFDPIYWKERYNFKDKKLHVSLFAVQTLFVRRVNESMIKKCLNFLVEAGADLDMSAVKLWLTAERSPYDRYNCDDTVTARDVIIEMIDIDQVIPGQNIYFQHLLEKVDLSSSTVIDLITYRLNKLLAGRLCSLKSTRLSTSDIDFLYAEAITLQNISAIRIIRDNTGRDVPYWLRKPLLDIGYKTNLFKECEKRRIVNLLSSLKQDMITDKDQRYEIGNKTIFGKSYTELVGVLDYIDGNKRWLFPVALHQQAIASKKNPYTGNQLPNEFIVKIENYYAKYNRELIDVRLILTVEDVDNLIANDELILSNRVDWLKYTYSSMRDPDALGRFCRTCVNIPNDYLHICGVKTEDDLMDLSLKTIALDDIRIN